MGRIFSWHALPRGDPVAARSADAAAAAAAAEEGGASAAAAASGSGCLHRLRLRRRRCNKAWASTLFAPTPKGLVEPMVLPQGVG